MTNPNPEAMSPETLRRLVEADEVDTVLVAFTDHYGRLMGKRFDADFFVTDALDHGTHACDYLLTVDMEMEPVPGYRFANWELGYGDFHLVPDLSTLSLAGWTDRTALVLCDLVDHGGGVAADGDGAGPSPVAPAPRSMLRSQVERLDASGLTAMAASELEFFLYDDSYRQAHDKGYHDLDPAGYYIEDYHLLQGGRVEPYVGAARRALRRTGIPVENSKGEWGRGQHELNIRYADVLTMADRHTVMKHAMKELAEAIGVAVTFMAKPHTTEAGNSCHIHLSLWSGSDDDRVNAFFAGGGVERSDLFRWFLGGWMANVVDFMPFYAPTVNAYKRYADGSWAPTRIAWSKDNRTAGFRVVGHGSSLRIECRIPGADCNPYLAYAAALASGLHGIEHRTEPPEAFVGDVYQAADLPRVPYTLEQALVGFRSSHVARAAFGDDVIDHYGHFFEVEVAAWNESVTDWERRRYFERI
ncbi:MAG: glutamine synthetase family protein [Acidimicrobiia bacterium]|nr:glutamine synthetase family protein [Acidimicrobiia bacterium]